MTAKNEAELLNKTHTFEYVEIYEIQKRTHTLDQPAVIITKYHSTPQRASAELLTLTDEERVDDIVARVRALKVETGEYYLAIKPLELNEKDYVQEAQTKVRANLTKPERLLLGIE